MGWFILSLKLKGDRGSYTMNLLQKWQNRRRGSLLENTVMLYILQFSNMALALLTQSYQVRVLGMDLIGTLGAAQYLTNFFQIFIDFGFILSATAKISKHQHDKEYLSRVLSCVLAAKVLFMAVSLAVMLLIIRPTLKDSGEFLIYMIYLFSVMMASFLPDFMYRGLEQMTTITIRAVTIKLFATVMIFVFVKERADYYMVPLFTAIGNAGALAFVYWHLIKKVGVRFKRVSLKEIWQEIKDGSQFFISKAAVAINANLNGIILKEAAGTTAVGVYTNADKIIVAARSGMSPIADSLYPHMMKNRNFKLIKKALLFLYPVILLGCAVVFIFAQPICEIWLGPEGAQVATPLRILIPTAVFAFPNYVLGYPTLGAMGLAKYANLSVLWGTALYLLSMGVLWVTGFIGLYSLCVVTAGVELFILIFRVTVIVKNRGLMQPPPEERAEVKASK